MTRGRRKPVINRRSAMIGAPIAILLVAGVLFQILMATAPKPEQITDGPLPIAVEIAVARLENTKLSVKTQGEVKPKTEAEIAARVAGQIVFLSPQLEAGAAVDAGDIIARIDPADYQLAIQRSRSEVLRAREALARVQSEATLAEDDWAQLGLEGDPSDLTLQKPQVASAIAALETARATVRENQLNLQRTEIKAPFDGRVRQRQSNLGDFVVVGAPIATIFATDIAQARVPLTDDDLAVLGVAPGYVASESGASLLARLSATIASKQWEWVGALALVEASVDPQTRLTYGLVEVTDPFADGAKPPLAPGMFVEISLEGQASEALVTFPRAALKKNQFVYVVDDDNLIAAREVSPVMTKDGELFVREGLRPGERIVQSYIPSPRDGMKVRDINISASAPRETSAMTNE